MWKQRGCGHASVMFAVGLDTAAEAPLKLLQVKQPQRPGTTAVRLLGLYITQCGFMLEFCVI